MSDRISGSYPGGPRRRGEGDAPPATRLETLEERGSRSSRSRRAGTLRQRRRRVAAVFGGALLVAGFAGWALGRSADKGSEELTAAREQTRERGPLEGMLRGEANRVIQQMWLSEIVERQPLPPR